MEDVHQWMYVSGYGGSIVNAHHPAQQVQKPWTSVDIYIGDLVLLFHHAISKWSSSTISNIWDQDPPVGHDSVFDQL